MGSLGWHPHNLLSKVKIIIMAFGSSSFKQGIIMFGKADWQDLGAKGILAGK